MAASKSIPTETRTVLAIIWLWSGMVSLGLYPVADSLVLLERVGLTGMPALAALYAGATLDIALGLLTLRFPGRRLWMIQGVVVAFYTVILTLSMPELWLHPFGPVLKNLAVFNLLWLLYRNERRER